MPFNFQLYDSWKSLNKKLRHQLHLEATNVEVQAYAGINHALMELTQGLLKLFPHKKQVLFLKDAEPYFEAPIKELAKEGIKVVPIKKEEIAEGLKEKLSKETLFFLFCYDTPLLGATLDTDPIRKILKEERVFRVGVSHSYHLYHDLTAGLDRYEARILNLKPELAIGLLGEKAKLESVAAKGLIWSEHLAEESSQLLKKSEEAKEKILEFEAAQPAGMRTVFKEGDSRLYDRSVFYWEDMDGYAFISEMAKELDIELKPPGQEDRLETSSLSRWGGVRTMDWLKNYDLSLSSIRGLVCVNEKVIDENFSNKVVKVRERILKIQNGE